MSCNWTAGQVSSLMTKVNRMHAAEGLHRYNLWKLMLYLVYYVGLGVYREQARKGGDGIARFARLLTGGKVLNFHIYAYLGFDNETINVSLDDWVDESAGLTFTYDYLYWRAASGYYEYDIEGYIYLPSIEVLAWIRDMMNFGSDEVQVGEYDSALGMKGADMASIWGFDTIPVTDRQFVTKWFKALFPEWNSSMGGPQ